MRDSVSSQILESDLSHRKRGGLRAAGYFKISTPEKPIVTIITAVFNGAQYIEQTISSVLNQTYYNVEYIIIDGGSADGTLDIIRKYDDKIDYWVSEPDKGIYDAMNKGWAAASENSYILFLGAGDRILSLPLNLAQIGNNCVIFGKVLLQTGKAFSSRVNWRLRFENTLHHQALLTPKALHPTPPFQAEYRLFGDFDFNQRLFKQGTKFVKSDDFIADAIPAGASGVGNIKEYVSITKKNFGLFWAAVTLAECFYHKLKLFIRRYIYSKNHKIG
jgi:glycosyltransferase involved in cell wall biosynthesis